MRGLYIGCIDIGVCACENVSATNLEITVNSLV